MKEATIGDAIRKWRLERGLTQSDIAKKLGVTTQNYSQWEVGKRNPKMDTLKKIAEILDVDVWTLIGFNRIDYENPPALPSNIRPIDAMHRQKVPLIGKVAAGEPILAEEDYETYVDAPAKCDVALIVEGESMLPTYQPGDILYIRLQPNVEEGHVAVVLLDDSATVKHVYHAPDGRGLTLISDNPAYAPIQVTDDTYSYVRIYGVPVGFTRMYRKDPAGMVRKGMPHGRD